MGHIEVIALICVYTAFLIIATVKLPVYIITIKKQCKTRKIQKQQKLKNTIKAVVLSYLKELQDEATKEVQTHETRDIPET